MDWIENVWHINETDADLTIIINKGKEHNNNNKGTK